MFSGKKIFPYLSWGIFISVGLYGAGTVSTSTLKLNKKDGLLIPDVEYHNADPLPEDWINMIEEKPDRKAARISTHEGSNSQVSAQIQGLSDLLNE